MSLFFRPRATPSARRGGFTLIELLVVIGVITLVSALMFANIKSFGGQTQVQNLAYDVALSMREAQVYGVSVKASNTTGVHTYGNGYGLFFDTTNNGTYHMFADSNTNGVYAGPSEDVAPSPFKIGNGFSIRGLYGLDSLGVSHPITQMVVLFIRPEPNAYILNPTTGSGMSGNCNRDPNDGVEICSAAAAYVQGRIVLVSPRGDYSQIVVSANGQISVQPDPTGN